MKQRKRLSYISFMLMLAFALTACSAAKSDRSGMENSAGSSDAVAPQEAGMSEDQKEAPESDFTDSDGLSSAAGLSTEVSAVETQDKIIRTFYLDVETQEFDSLINRIKSEIGRLEGYVESSDISGRGYNSRRSTRYGSIVARIPSSKVNDFVDTVNDNANVVSQKESSENVSLQYIDAKSKVETLKLEQERLFAILEKEVSMENIISLESRLSDIRYELQNYESKLRYYDNKVAYSTVTMSIQEVEKLTPVEEEKPTVATRISNGFSDTVYNLSEGVKDFVVWFIVNLPYLIIWAVIIAAIVIAVRRIYKRRRGKLERILTPPVQDTASGEKKDS